MFLKRTLSLSVSLARIPIVTRRVRAAFRRRHCLCAIRRRDKRKLPVLLFTTKTKRVCFEITTARAFDWLLLTR